ncbi:hypothetical protein ACJJTC_019331 [Scirpophaga incertulas]
MYVVVIAQGSNECARPGAGRWHRARRADSVYNRASTVLAAREHALQRNLAESTAESRAPVMVTLPGSQSYRSRSRKCTELERADRSRGRRSVTMLNCTDLECILHHHHYYAHLHHIHRLQNAKESGEGALAGT